MILLRAEHRYFLRAEHRYSPYSRSICLEPSYFLCFHKLLFSINIILTGETGAATTDCETKSKNNAEVKMEDPMFITLEYYRSVYIMF